MIDVTVASLHRQLALVEENERRRLSRELHDCLGQNLTALTLGIDEVDRMVSGNDATHARLVRLQAIVRTLMRDVRHLAVELRPPALDDVGLASALASYVDAWTERSGVHADVQMEDLGDVLTSERATTIYRVVQEALANVANHAGARHASVIVTLRGDEVRLIVEDDGLGFDIDAPPPRAPAERRLGLVGMRERVALVGGEIAIESSPGDGTTIYVTLPIVS